jgi:predicted glutamate--cysteine ligase
LFRAGALILLARLKKGIEVEVFTGTREGRAVALSPQIVPYLDRFVYESDARHIEYITDPHTDDNALLREILEPRLNLRKHLETLGDYTVLPGSTIALPFNQEFELSRPNNTYYQWVGRQFGTNILTSSVHISVGLDTCEEVIHVNNWLRMDVPLLLALTASSPYKNGEATGFHSSRWNYFPQEPSPMRFFNDHQDFVGFVEDALAKGQMQSVRHMWSALRPNGHNRPYDLNRVEVRICDLVMDPQVLLAISALLEARIYHLLMKTGVPDQKLMAVSLENERRIAKDSLNAQVFFYGQEVDVKFAIRRLMMECEGLMEAMGTAHHLETLERVLVEGNEAMRFIKRVDELGDLEAAVIEAIDEAEAIDMRAARALSLVTV